MHPLNMMIIAMAHQFPCDKLFVPHAPNQNRTERSWERTIRERMEAGCNVVPLKLDDEGAVYLH